MKLDDNIIFSFIKNCYNKNIEKYGSNQILGTFVVGLANYGFAETAEEIQTVTVYLPTFEELCIGGIEYDNTDGFSEELYDIRKAYNAVLNHKDYSLELLYSDFYIINPKYKKIWQDNFIGQREQISKVNKKDRLLKARDRAKLAFENGNTFEAARLYIGAKEYVNSSECTKAFHIEDELLKDLLWKYKKSPSDFLDIDNIISKMNSFIDKVDEEIDFKADLIIKNGVLTLMQSALQKTVSYDAFINNLTNMELKAWAKIKTLLQSGINIISVSKLTEETEISRPVFKNLFLKLEQDNIAHINNMGVKGTEIKLIDESIIK